MINAPPGVSVRKVSDRTFLLHLGGKLSVEPKVPLKNRDDLSRAYTPGVARVCLAIAANPEDARRLTIKRNTVAVVTDGTAVLGLGDIGPAAALPVMEGKAALFKQFAGVDAWPVCLDTKDTEEIIAIVKALAPVYGGVNLEDIAAPRCFEIERRLRDELDIPVFHDDQHGTAIVVLAALINALRVVDKKIGDVKIVVSGVGAAGHAIIQLLQAQGAGHIVACSRNGAIHRGETYTDEHREWIAREHQPERLLRHPARGPGRRRRLHRRLRPEPVRRRRGRRRWPTDAIVLALANPDPEIHPTEAAKHAAVVATGRSDFPNQINNVLAFPGLFRGLLDAAARRSPRRCWWRPPRRSPTACPRDELNASYIVPSVFDARVAPAVAEASSQPLDAPRPREHPA